MRGYRVMGAASAAALLMSAVAADVSSSPDAPAGRVTAHAGPHAQLLVNGGFERPRIDEPWVAFFPDGAEIPGWTVVRGSVDVVGTDWPAGRGEQSLGLNGFGPGTIRQNVPTAPGATYRVAFLLWGDPNGPPSRSRMQVRWGGQWVASLGVDVSREPTWRRIVLHLVASSSRTALTFRGLTETNAGPALDAVSVRQLSPATSMGPP
jgi:hypothetical protein